MLTSASASVSWARRSVSSTTTATSHAKRRRPRWAWVLHHRLGAHDVHLENTGARCHHAGSAFLLAGGPLHHEYHRPLRVHRCTRDEADLEDAASDGSGLSTLSVGPGVCLDARDDTTFARHE